MKKEFVIVVDSSSDLSKHYRDTYGIRYVRMGVVKNVGKENEEEVLTSLDWDVFSHKEFNDWQRQGMKLKTTQVSHDEYRNVFKSIIEEGKDVLYLACSSGLSGSYSFSLAVKEELLEKYPDAKIICVDCLRASIGQGMIAIDAGKLQKEGKTIEEVAAYVEENKLCYLQFGTVESLEYLKRAGRVSGPAAFFGNLFGVKPMIISTDTGLNFAVKKTKGRKNSIVEVARMMSESIVDASNSTIYIVHADCIDAAELLKEEMIKLMNPKEVVIDFMGPVIGASVGPGTLITFCKGKKNYDNIYNW